jgi:hypothetical protein
MHKERFWLKWADFWRFPVYFAYFSGIFPSFQEGAIFGGWLFFPAARGPGISPI